MSNTALIQRSSRGGRGHRKACAVLGAALVPDAGRPAEARSARSLRARRASRRHRRALVLLHHQRRQRSRHAADEGLSYIDLGGGKRVLLKEAIETLGDEFLGADVMREQRRLERALQVLRQPRPHSASHAPVRGARQTSASMASPRPITSRRNTISRTTIFPTPSWASSPAPRRTTCAAAWSAGTKATTEFCIIRRPTSCSPARDRPRRARLGMSPSPPSARRSRLTAPPRTPATPTSGPRQRVLVTGTHDIVIPTINSYILQQFLPTAELILYPERQLRAFPVPRAVRPPHAHIPRRLVSSG